jgi:hypothetical protein
MSTLKSVIASLLKFIILRVSSGRSTSACTEAPRASAGASATAARPETLLPQVPLPRAALAARATLSAAVAQ